MEYEVLVWTLIIVSFAGGISLMLYANSSIKRRLKADEHLCCNCKHEAGCSEFLETMRYCLKRNRVNWTKADKRTPKQHEPKALEDDPYLWPCNS